MSIKFSIKQTRITNVTFDTFNDKVTAFADDGRTIVINREEYNSMIWDIKKSGFYILEEKDYSGNSFQDLMNNIFQ